MSNRYEKVPSVDSKYSGHEIKILCFDLSFYNKTTQFLLCCLGVFILYLAYGYFMELIFTLEDFKAFVWYLTLIQFAYYTIFGYVAKTVFHKKAERCIPIKTYLLLAFLTLGTMGLSNASLRYLNYPTQVIFKCCKLVPVLIGSILIQKKNHGPLEFLAAIAMCVGLTLFTLADSQISPIFNFVGVLMISTALLFDAAIGNVQEKSMRQYKATNNEVVLYSYGIGFIYLFVYMLFSGDIVDSFNFCLKHPMQTYGYAFLLSISGYLGIQIVLTLVLVANAPTAAFVTTLRKTITIILSFVFFSKPFTFQYLWSGSIVVLGIYLSVYSKRNKMTTAELIAKVRQFLRLEARPEDRKKLMIEV